MDKFHACEHLGPGGVKCPCCGRTATNKTKRTRLKRQLRTEITQLLPPPPNPPLPLGTSVPPYGTIVAVRWDGYERYYFLTNQHGNTAMLPADNIEPGA